jgi:hypothetical protein
MNRLVSLDFNSYYPYLIFCILGGASRPESAMETNEDHEENGAVKQNGEKHRLVFIYL